MTLAVGFERTTGLEKDRKISRVLPPVAVGPPGHSIQVTWPRAAGATRAEVDVATLTVGPDLALRTSGDLPLAATDGGFQVTIPAGELVRALGLRGLARGDVALSSEADLSANGLRLVVSPRQGGDWGAPLFSVPSVGARGLLPGSLTGASYAAGILALPDVAGPRLRISLVEGSFPEDFTPVGDMALEAASGTLAVPAVDLRLVGPDEAVVWSMPGPYPAALPEQEIDLRMPLQQALEGALGDGGSASVTVAFRLVAANAASARVRFSGARGALVRTFPGVLPVTLSGDPVSLPLPAAPPPAEEVPASATADVSVRYAGLRMHATLSDAVPPSGGAAGSVVGPEPVVRALPAARGSGAPVARVGLVGRTPEGCELSVELVRMVGGGPGEALGPRAVLRVEPSAGLATAWFDLARRTVGSEGPVGVAARCTNGRFLWADGPNGPRIRVAVADPDPGGRPVRVGGATLLAVDGPEVHRPAHRLPAGAFISAPPFLDSELFGVVEIADLSLRYAR
jgi:hypothetical protein